MSNKETLQQHNSRLNANNTDLSSILDTINNLPSGGKISIKNQYVEGKKLIIELSDNSNIIVDLSPYIDGELTPEQIQAINDMIIYIKNGELITEYDDEVLDIDFQLQEENLVIENNVNGINFNINENEELEVTY